MSHYKNEQLPRGDGPLIRRHRIRDIPLEHSSPVGMVVNWLPPEVFSYAKQSGSGVRFTVGFWNRVEPRTRVVDTWAL